MAIDYNALLGEEPLPPKTAAELVSPREKWEDPLLGYALSSSREVMCLGCAHLEMGERGGRHPKLDGKGYTIPIVKWRGGATTEGDCLFCGVRIIGARG